MTCSPMRPRRTCLGCRTVRNKEELLRIGRTDGGAVALDPHGRAGGRGAYLCFDPACLKRIKKTGALARALKCSVPEAIYAEAEALIGAGEGTGAGRQEHDD